MKNNLLSQAEQQVMDVFWSVDTPLTSVELSKHSTEKGWKSSYIYILIRSLLKKQMIEPCGTLQYGTQYARQFKPIVSKEEYAARLALGSQFCLQSGCFTGSTDLVGYCRNCETIGGHHSRISQRNIEVNR